MEELPPRVEQKRGALRSGWLLSGSILAAPLHRLAGAICPLIPNEERRWGGKRYVAGMVHTQSIDNGGGSLVATLWQWILSNVPLNRWGDTH